MGDWKMNNVLSGLERDIVVSYLCDSAVPFTLIPNQPAEQIFSFATCTCGIKVLQEGIILFTDPRVLPIDILGSQIEIRFYFRKLGLSFISKISKTKTGALAIVIPREILRLPEVTSKFEVPFSCKVFLGECFSGDYISCQQKNNFPLLKPLTWELLPENLNDNLIFLLKKYLGAEIVELPSVVLKTMGSSGKALYICENSLPVKNPFSFDACFLQQDVSFSSDFSDAITTLKDGFYFMSGTADAIMGMAFFIPIKSVHDIESLLPFIPICIFLSNETKEFQTIQGRFSPIYVLFVNNKEIILATDSGPFPLQKEISYSTLLQMPVQSMRRSITFSCYYNSLFQFENKTCVRCSLEQLKAEDERFLYESFTGKIFS